MKKGPRYRHSGRNARSRILKPSKLLTSYPTFELLLSPFCGSNPELFDGDHKSVRLSHSELTTLFHLRRAFLSQLSSIIWGEVCRTFSSMDLLILLLMLFRLFKLLRSIELLVGLMMGIFDFDVIAFSMILILLDKCVNVKHEKVTTNRLNVYLVYIQLLAFTQVSDPFVSKIKSFLFSSHKIPESHTKSGQFYNKIIFFSHSEW